MINYYYRIKEAVWLETITYGFVGSYGWPNFVDRGIFEILGPTGLSSTASLIGLSLHRLQTGSLYHLTLTILVGITVLFSLRHLSIIISVADVYWLDYKLVVLIFISFLFLISSLESSKED